ncbi:hypothetical protein LOK49_LG13G00677 [Camellia lanceoleosa]|uniref:Uncharacterized protein n=1 Tax=Camellia lanceoleosa TaxID=1840588 RepID=A0ACC0FHL7_9ERIC|nr:hypothetical protein LOK49_LG13G00677 [Camellia lanceoleosa]
MAGWMEGQDQVLYDDGDLEVLCLDKEHRQLIDNGHKPTKKSKPSKGSPHKELQRLMQFASTKMCERIDIPQISLGILNGMVKSDFPNEKSHAQWKKRQVNILEELLCSANNRTTEQQTIGSLLTKVKNSKNKV